MSRAERCIALHCAALSGVEVSGVEVSGVEVSVAEMPRRCPERSRGEEHYADVVRDWLRKMLKVSPRIPIRLSGTGPINPDRLLEQGYTCFESCRATGPRRCEWSASNRHFLLRILRTAPSSEKNRGSFRSLRTFSADHV